MMNQNYRASSILLVTENPSIQFWVKKHLDDQFFIIQTERYTQALSMAQGELDFILIDSEIDSFDPLELVKRIYMDVTKGKCPILLITDRLKKKYREEAKKAGVAEFLSASIDHEELLERIESGRQAEVSKKKTATLTQGFQLKTGAQKSGALKGKVVFDSKTLSRLQKAEQEGESCHLVLVRCDRQAIRWFRDLFALEVLVFPEEEGVFLLFFNEDQSRFKRKIEKLGHEVLEEFGEFFPALCASAVDPTPKAIIAKLKEAKRAFSKDKKLIFLDQEKE